MQIHREAKINTSKLFIWPIKIYRLKKNKKTKTSPNYKDIKSRKHAGCKPAGVRTTQQGTQAN